MVDIPDDWERVRTETLAADEPHAMATGPFGSSIGSATFIPEPGVPVVRGSNLSEDVGQRLSHDKLVFIPGPLADKFRRSEARDGDLIFTCWGTIGQVGLVDKRARYPRYIVSNKQMKLSVNTGRVDSLFLYYCFSSPEVSGSIRSQKIGSSVPGFNLGQLKAIELNLPPIDEQRRIAAVLGALDDKIELNRKMNRTLEEMAQAIFKSWFIDFDGVDASEMVDSELGPIPKGWKIAELEKASSYLRRGISPKYTEEGGVAVINQKCIRECRVSLEKARRHDPAKRKIDGRELQVGDVLVNSTGVGTLGRVAQLDSLDEPLICDSHVTVVRAAPEVDALFLGAQLMHLQPVIEGMGHGSTGQTELSRKNLGTLRVRLPGRELQDSFADTVRPLRAKMSANEQQSETLAQLRDTLLPKLISGEIRVPAAEKTIEATL
ncbi:MAG: restriction endonuclease subunit S [Nannocystaceae bacterium]|nr:restriction endonuclease subunit S [bacterium]